ncbi:MAG: hypothetical protein ACREQY_11825 [Candidatus Binatia bacterium]
MIERYATILTTTLAAAGCAAAFAAPAAADDPRGYIYGTIETESGKRYTGVLRWGGEEAFWDDHFNGSKLDEPATGELPRNFRRNRKRVEVFGLEISGPWEHGWEQRSLAVRFGDLVEIRPKGGDRAELVFKGGERMKIEGGSNDFGDDITVDDPSLGEVDIDWDRIASIRFAQTPANAKPAGKRLRARVKTTVGEFSGWLAWDNDERVTTDVLDGESEDGDLELPMGKIKSIERRSRRSCRVSLTDGRSFDMSGTNDVDSSTNGIVVEDERFGRVEIPWEVFERADIEVAADSGKGYDDYPPHGPLRATVTASDGRSFSGEIAFDLDETRQWEFLDGEQDDVEYHVPFSMVKEVRPIGRRRSEVTLRNGQKLTLEGQTDVDESNAGVALLAGKAGEDRYVPWQDVAKVVFD